MAVNWNKNLKDWMTNSYNPAPNINIENARTDTEDYTDNAHPVQQSTPQAPVQQSKPTNNVANIFNRFGNGVVGGLLNAESNFLYGLSKLPQAQFASPITNKVKNLVDNTSNDWDTQNNNGGMAYSAGKALPNLAMAFVPGVGLELSAANAAAEGGNQAQAAGKGGMAQLGNALTKGALNYGLMKLPIGSLGGEVGGTLTSKLGSVAKTAALGAGAGSLGSVGNTITDKAFVNPNTQFNGNDILSNALMGGVLGGGLRGVEALRPNVKLPNNTSNDIAPLPKETPSTNDIGPLTRPSINNEIPLGTTPPTSKIASLTKPSISNEIPLPKTPIDTMPISKRDFSNVSDKSVNAYQYDHPNLKPYIQSEANILKGELQRTVPGQRSGNYVKGPGESGLGDYYDTSSQRITSDAIANIKDLTGASYDKINQGIDNIIKDNGAENNALSKKIELIIDDRLNNGYTDDMTGMQIPANKDYVNSVNNLYNPSKSVNSDTIKPKNGSLAMKIEGPDNNYNISSVGDILGNPLKNNLNDNTMTLKESQFKTNTMRNASMLQQKDTQKMIDNVNAWYDVKPNEQTMNNAFNELQTNPQSVIDRIKKSESLNSAEDAAAAGLITNNLRQEAAQTGDYSKLKDWLETVQPKVTSTAQSLQAISTWKNLTPEGALIKAQQIVGKVNRDGLKDFGKKFSKVELTEDDMKYINDSMTNIQNMSDSRQKDIEFAKVKQFIANKIPPTLTDKLNSWRRISMLLNPKTMVRNTLGNIIMSGLENAKDVVATPIDKLVGLKTGERTTMLPNLFTQGKGFTQGVKETLQDAKAGANTSPTMGQYEIPQAQSFRKGVLSKLESATNTGLTLGDRPFYQAAYDDALRQQMKINKTNTPTEDMITNATNVAKDRTFQNESLIAKSFDGLRRNLNQLGAGMGIGNEQTGIGNAVLPFTKTPANILDKATDYSPIGTIKGISQLISKKQFNQKQFVDRIGRSLTGTALIALGADLAKNGLITGAANKDKDVAALEKQVGKSPYAFKMGDTYRTFDWAQPASTPLAIGADMYNAYKNSKDVTKAIGEAVLSGGSTLFNQSLLQGVQKFFGGSNPGSNNILSNAANAGQSFITSLVPTSSKQIAQLVDNKQRDTSGGLKDQLLSRIPFASKTLPGKVDTMGRDMLQYQGNNNLFNIFLNPGYTTKYNPSKAEQLALDIYKNTGETSQFPRVAPNKITYKDENNQTQTLPLKQPDILQLQRLMGQGTQQAYDNYNLGTDYPQAIKDLQKILTDVSTNSKNELLRQKSIQTYIKPPTSKKTSTSKKGVMNWPKK